MFVCRHKYIKCNVLSMMRAILCVFVCETRNDVMANKQKGFTLPGDIKLITPND